MPYFFNSHLTKEIIGKDSNVVLQILEFAIFTLKDIVTGCGN